VVFVSSSSSDSRHQARTWLSHAGFFYAIAPRSIGLKEKWLLLEVRVIPTDMTGFPPSLRSFRFSSDTWEGIVRSIKKKTH